MMSLDENATPLSGLGIGFYQLKWKYVWTTQRKINTQISGMLD